MLYSDIKNDFTADGTSGAFGFFNNEATCRSSVAQLSAAGYRLPSPQFLAPTPAASFLGPYTASTCDGTQYLRIDLANNVAPADGKASLLTAMSIVQAVRNRSAGLRV